MKAIWDGIQTKKRRKFQRFLVSYYNYVSMGSALFTLRRQESNFIALSVSKTSFADTSPVVGGKNAHLKACADSSAPPLGAQYRYAIPLLSPKVTERVIGSPTPFTLSQAAPDFNLIAKLINFLFPFSKKCGKIYILS